MRFAKSGNARDVAAHEYLSPYRAIVATKPRPVGGALVRFCGQSLECPGSFAASLGPEQIAPGILRMIGEVESLNAPSQGAHRDAQGATHFRLWAPHQQKIAVLIGQGPERVVRRMRSTEAGYFEHSEPGLAAGAHYMYRVGDERRELPDPVSRWQPDGVHRTSAVYDPHSFAWSDAAWRGVSAEDLSIYELHVGTFTPAGTFEAIVPRLEQLRDLGITAIELMPIAQFSGERNWGYDGVHPFAAQNSYGGPRGLQQLVDAAHRAGLGVILDVVYNHLGPEGNYFEVFAPYFTERYHTPWGRALNYDGRDSDPVRQLVLDNAAMWIRDFHLDGLRLDAVQTIYDESAKHLLAEIQDTVQEIARAQQRHVVVIAETNQNDFRLVAPRAAGGHALDGIWSDDFHHSVHALLTGERDGYYQAFGTPEQLAKSFRNVFIYDGCYSPFYRRRHGNRVGETPRDRFVNCLQNHDQVGNRALGERLSSLLSPAELRLAASLLLLAPTTPLLFMGEEYGEIHPFPFFCSFSDAGLIEAVRRGRRAELKSINFDWKHEPPDPQATASFAAAKLSWSWSEPIAAGLRALYRDLLRARRSWPALRERKVVAAEIERSSEGAAILRLQLGRQHRLAVWANLSPNPVAIPLSAAAVPIFSSAAVEYGGDRPRSAVRAQLAPWECAVWETAEGS